jgi:hypothetical protein
MATSGIAKAPAIATVIARRLTQFRNDILAQIPLAKTATFESMDPFSVYASVSFWEQRYFFRRDGPSIKTSMLLIKFVSHSTLASITRKTDNLKLSVPASTITQTVSKN